MKHKHRILFFTIAIFLTATTFSQDKKITAINHLFEVMDVKNLTSKIMGATYEGMFNSFPTTDTLNFSPEKKAKMGAIKVFVQQEMNKFMDSYISKDLVEIYNKHFTQQEIKDITAFYKSSTGKKMLAVSPEIQKESMQKMGPFMQDFQIKLQAKIQELME